MQAPAQPSVTVAVIARDEERNIAACLQTLDWADERLVLVDAATRDRTREEARRCGARVEERAFDTFAAQRDAALDLARSEWVLFVDADERVSAHLAQEICRAISQPGAQDGYWIPRHNYILGRRVRGAGWYPDYQLRLLRRTAAHFDPSRSVHELALLDGPAGYLVTPFEHYSHPTLRDFAIKQKRYTRLAAEDWLRAHGRPRLRALVGQPLRELWRRYITLRGYQDGPLGLALCLILSWYAARTIVLARRLARRDA
jgi:hypothetical protein